MTGTIYKHTDVCLVSEDGTGKGFAYRTRHCSPVIQSVMSTECVTTFQLPEWSKCVWRSVGMNTIKHTVSQPCSKYAHQYVEANWTIFMTVKDQDA